MSESELSYAARTLAGLIEGRLQGEKLNYENLAHNVAKSMEIAQHMSHLSGEQKKQAVTKAICLAIDRSDVAGPFEGVVLEIVPKLCDTIIEVDKGRLVINKRLRNRLFKFNCCS